MTTTTRSRSRFAACAVVLMLVGSACGESPTATVAPSEALMTGGITFGSGNRAGADTTGAQNTTAADTGSAARQGGITFGSGN